jgi:hypothetical protein
VNVLSRALASAALAGLTALSAVAGCARTPMHTGSAQSHTPQLTLAELADVNANNLYDAIEKLRPEWLTSRGPTSVTDNTPSLADVYMNGTMLGNADYLRNVGLIDVTAVRYWDTGQASARFGMGHPRGVIEIIRK